MSGEQTVYVVDDDPPVARAFARLLRASGYTAQVFGSAREFMDFVKPDSTGCLVTDFSMPEINGLDLKQWMANAGHAVPIIFVTGFDDLTIEERMITAGAVDILRKPVRPSLFLAAVERAFAGGREKILE